MIYKSWLEHWEDLREFFKYPPEIRRAIYTTNAVELLNYQLRKVTKNCSSFSTDDAVLKITLKKTFTYSEKSEGQRRKFTSALKKVPSKKRVYVDESGINTCLTREYTRAVRDRKR